MKKWTKEAAIKASKKCKTRSEFKKNYSGAYLLIKKIKLLDSLFPRERYNYKKAIQAIKKCKSLTEFHLKYHGASHWIRKNGLSKEIYLFLPSKRTDWNIPKVMAEVKKHKEMSTFSQTPAYQWLRKRKKLHLATPYLKPTRQCWDKKNILKAASKCKTRSEFYKKYSGAIGWLIRNKKLHILNTIFPIKYKIWTLEMVLEKAQLCRDRGEFSKKYENAYNWLLKRKLTHLIDFLPLSKRNPWTEEEAIIEARKFKRRSDFHKKSSGAYGWFLDNNKKYLLDDIFVKEIKEKDLQKIFKSIS